MNCQTPPCGSDSHLQGGSEPRGQEPSLEPQRTGSVLALAPGKDCGGSWPTPCPGEALLPRRLYFRVILRDAGGSLLSPSCSAVPSQPETCPQVSLCLPTDLPNGNRAGAMPSGPDLSVPMFVFPPFPKFESKYSTNVNLVLAIYPFGHSALFLQPRTVKINIHVQHF